MKRLKSFVYMAGIVLLVLAAASLYASIESLSQLRPAESYEDRGLRTFQPYDVLPVQVKNTSASSRDRRMNPTKTVYMVYYRATDGSGYRWREEVPAKSYGQKVVDAGETVERRILSIPEEGTYITIRPDQTAESYTAELRERYLCVMGLSAIYMLCYITVWIILAIRRRRSVETEMV